MSSSTVQASRSTILSSLSGQFEAARSGPGVVCLLTGASGIGKTHLTRRFLRQKPMEATFLESSALPTGSPPLFPVCEAIASGLKGRVHEEVRAALEQYCQALPVFRDVVGPLVRAHQQVEFSRVLARDFVSSEAHAFVALVEILRRLGKHGPIILFLDDIQWLDASSSAFIGFLGRHLRELPMFVILATKVNGAEPHGVSLLREALRKSEGLIVQSIHIPPLSVEETLVASELVLGGPTTFSLADAEWLRRSSKGSPQYLTEILALLKDHGQITLSHSHWAFTMTPASLVLPPTLADVTRLRFEEAFAEDRTAEVLVHYGAVCGQVFDASLVGKLSGLTTRQATLSLERLARRTGYLDRIDASTSFQFDHELTRNAILNVLGDVASGMHADIALALQAIPDASPADIGFHLERSGSISSAAGFYGKAAEATIRQCLFSEAIVQAARQVHLLENETGALAPNRRLEARALLSRALIGAEQYREAGDVLLPVLDSAVTLRHPEALHVFGQALLRAPDRSSCEEAAGRFRQALSLVDAERDPKLTSHIWTDLIYAYDALGQYPASTASFRKAYEAARRAHDALQVVRLSRISCVFWQPEKVIDAIARALLIAQKHGYRYESALCKNNLGAELFHLHRLHEARAYFDECIKDLHDLGGFRQDAPLNNLAVVGMMSGQWQRAEQLLSEAFDRARDPHNGIFIRSNRAVLMAMTGDLDTAVDQLKCVVDDADATGDAFYIDCARHNLAQALLDLGRADEALPIIVDCPPHHSRNDDELVMGKRANLVMRIQEAIGTEAASETSLRSAGIVERTTKPQAWLYRLPWYVCDIQYWED